MVRNFTSIRYRKAVELEDGHPGSQPYSQETHLFSCSVCGEDNFSEVKSSSADGGGGTELALRELMAH